MLTSRLKRAVTAVLIGLTPGVVAAQAPAVLSDSAFGALITRLSEQGGFFDTDNLISNEDSYLHPLTTLRRLGTRGGIYVGVGPDQNFSYIAAVRPRAAFIIDIRRDNLLEHLLFKAIFALSRNRADYLSMLFGRSSPADTTGLGGVGVGILLARVARAPPDSAARIAARVLAEVKRSGVRLSDADVETIRRFHQTFIAEGPALQFNTFGRAPNPSYPDFARLASETDRSGRQASFLGTEDAFQFVKRLEDRNLVIPVVGNFAGPRAFAAVAEWMTAHRERLSALYASNVEQYLYRDGGFDAFAANVLRLPRDSSSVIIRSCFTCRGGHASSVSGYYSVQMVQRVDRFASLRADGQLRQYFELVGTGVEPPR